MSAMKRSPLRLVFGTLPFLLTLAGCASVPETPSSDSISPVISVGLTEDEVAQRMGTSKVIGYQKNASTQSFEPLTIPQPYRTKTLNVDAETWKVAYYFIGVRTADGQVTDDELEPILFRDGKVVGRGWPFLRDLQKGSSTDSPK